MFLAYALGVAGSSLESGSFAQELEKSCTWRGKRFASHTWLRRLKRVSWLTRLSGLTLEPSMQRRFLEEWPSLLPDCPASRTALPESKKATTTSGQSGPNLSGSYPSVAPPWSSLKTCQPSLLVDSSGDLERNYRAWVTQSKARSSSVLATLAHRIKGSVCSSWPTPNLPLRGVCEAEMKRRTPDLQNQAVRWPTPRASLGANRATKPTPAAQNTRSGKASDTTMKRNARPLQEVVDRWATPVSADSTGTSGGKMEKSLRRDVLKNWATPRANERNQVNSRDSHVALSRQAQATTTHGGKSLKPTQLLCPPFPSTMPDGLRRECLFYRRLALNSELRGRPSHYTRPYLRKRLNPRFVEQLQGMKTGWTDLGCAEMASFQSWQVLHSQLLRKALGWN